MIAQRLLDRIPLTVPIYPEGMTLGSPEAWDAVRTSSDQHFGIPETTDEWRRAAERPNFQARARDVMNVASKLRANRICSYGVGTAMMELNLSGDVAVTEYAPLTVERLKDVFAHAFIHDLTRDPPVKADLHVFHRVETELTDRQWRELFTRFRAPILVVVDDYATGQHIRSAIRNRGRKASGWVRTRPRLLGLWRGTHCHEQVLIGELDGYLLLPR